jgi:hypothetical protein
MKIRIFRKPDDGTGSGSSTGEGSTGGAGGGTGGTTQRPDYVPEKFWNAEKGEVRVKEALTSYAEIQRLVSKRATELDTEDLKKLTEHRVAALRPEMEKQALAKVRGQAPKEAKEYKLELPAEAAERLPEDLRDLSKLEGDPLVEWWRGKAFELGLGQEQFIAGVSGFFEIIANAQAEATQAQIEALGDNANERLNTIKLHLQKHLPTEEADAIMAGATSAAAVQAIEKLIGLGKAQVGGAGGGSGNPPAGATKKTEAELKQMMNDERYWHPRKRDPQYIRQVQAEFARTFPGKIPA